MINVLLADDHDLMRQGIRALLETHPNISIFAEATNGAEAGEKAIEYKPDVVLLVVTMPKMSVLDAARLIREKVPATQIVMFTAHDRMEMVREILETGPHGYILNSYPS